METSIDYIDFDKAVVSTDEAKWHRRLREYKEKYPDLVHIKNEPENNDGNMVAEVPVKWVKIKPPKVCNLTDEERISRVEKMRNRVAKSLQSFDSEEAEDDDGE